MARGLVTTIPLEAKQTIPHLGILSLPIISDFLVKRFKNLELKVSLNTLDSNKKRTGYLEGFFSSLEHLGIQREHIWVDEDHQQELLKNIELLTQRGFIKKVRRRRLISPSKKVEILEGIPFNPRSRYIEKKGEKYYCNFSGEELSPLEGEALILDLPQIENLPGIYPENMEIEVKKHLKKIQGIEMLVSRERETGFKTEVDGKIFNLDIDILWATYLKTLMEGMDHGILVSSNHTTWHSSLVYSIFNALEKTERNIQIYLIPYILPKRKEFYFFLSGGYMGRDPNISRLLIMNSISQHRKNVYWAENLLDPKIAERIERIKEKLYQATNVYEEENDFKELLTLIKKENIERAIKIRKCYHEQSKIDIRGMIL